MKTKVILFFVDLIAFILLPTTNSTLLFECLQVIMIIIIIITSTNFDYFCVILTYI